MIVMMLDSLVYGLEESIGVHVLLSNIFWWLAVGLVIVAYKHREMWNVGKVTWVFLFLVFFFFGIRELGHFSQSLLVGTIRYIFGIWAVIFMTFTFIYLYEIIYKRKNVSSIKIYIPFALALIFPAILISLYSSGVSLGELKNTFSTIEALAWISGSIVTIYTTYRLGTRASGDFINIFMFFQFAAFSAFVWKFLGFIGQISCPAPYSIRELIETLFGLFAVISIILLTKMLKKLSHMHK